MCNGYWINSKIKVGETNFVVYALHMRKLERKLVKKKCNEKCSAEKRGAFSIGAPGSARFFTD